MRRVLLTLLLPVFIILAASCQRRDFANKTTGVNVEISIDTEVDLPGGVAVPDIMRVDLYEPETGKLKYTDYISSTGGVIHPAPGNYDMIVSTRRVPRFETNPILMILRPLPVMCRPT